MILNNRFVRSATWEGLADKNGLCTSEFTELMVKLARGGVGLIITGHAYTDTAGQSSPFQLGIHRDDCIRPLKEMTTAVHDAGGRIMLQISHGGCQAIPKLTGSEPAGPSALEIGGKPFCREITSEEISKAVKAFGQAAERAKKSGFDGVQIHAAHSYLLNQFLSPFYNRRTDQYGGSLRNRARFTLDVCREVRAHVGINFPLIIKLNSEDFLEKGFVVEEMIEVAKMLETEGIDAIELSGGTIQSDRTLRPVRPGRIDSEDKEVYYREAARRYKESITVPLILVGGIRSFSVAESLIDEGIADFVSLSRPLIREPDLINRWKSGDQSSSECRSDNACFKPGIKGKGIYCVVREKEEGIKP